MKKFLLNCLVAFCYSVSSMIGMIVGLGAMGAFMEEHERIVRNRIKREETEE